MNPQKGTLKAWKPEKGFGFITPSDGSRDVFVHIRDFGNIGRKPQVGDSVTYQPMRGNDGRYRAADVQIEGVARIPAGKRQRAGRPRRPNSSLRIPKIAVALLIPFALVVYSQHQLATQRTSPLISAKENRSSVVAKSFHCEGKQHCSEMRSCAEARYYLANCPNTKMDGDRDGIPCEQQWCR